MITPFYSDDLVAIYCCDFAAAPVDFSRIGAVITDPPYGETSFRWDCWPDGWPRWLMPRLAPWASLWCFGSFRMFRDRHADFSGWQFAQDVVWEKANGTSPASDRFRRVHELAAHFYPARSSWRSIFKAPVLRQIEADRKCGPVNRRAKPGQWGEIGGAVYQFNGTRLARSVMFAPSVRQGVRHGTPKPVSILRDLIAYSCPPPLATLDLFCGSGSTLVAAKELGRPAVGVDADPAACREAAERCAGVRPLG